MYNIPFAIFIATGFCFERSGVFLVLFCACYFWCYIGWGDFYLLPPHDGCNTVFCGFSAFSD